MVGGMAASRSSHDSTYEDPSGLFLFRNDTPTPLINDCLMMEIIYATMVGAGMAAPRSRLKESSYADT